MPRTCLGRMLGEETDGFKGPRLSKIRVYMSNLERLPESILRASLRAAEGIEVVGEEELDVRLEISDHPSAPTEPPKLPRGGYWDQVISEIEEHDPDVVIFGQESQRRAGELASLLDARVLLLSSRGTTLHCRQLRPDPRVVGSVSFEELVSLIRNSGDAGQATDPA